MARGRVSPRKAARLLGRHFNTVYAWCRAAERGEDSPLYDVARGDNGYLSIAREDVERLRSTVKVDFLSYIEDDED
jgi:transposase